MRMSLALEMSGVAKRYVAGMGGCVASVQALRTIDLTLRPGDAVAVVGPRGSGKSTLLLVAAGLLVPDAGDVRWLGDSTRAASERYAVYHSAGARHPSSRMPPTSRIHLIDNPEALGRAGAARLALWIGRRCADGGAVLIGTRNRAIAHMLAPCALTLAAGQLRMAAMAAPRVAESVRW